MGNPWLDSDVARAWASGPKPGNPLHDEQLAVVQALVGAQAPARHLDLGCGPGDVTKRIVRGHPASEVVGLDASAVMLARAEVELASRGGPTRFVRADATEDWTGLVRGPFDCVSALNIVHHLEPEAKQAVFAMVARVLSPGGLFILADRIAFDPRLTAHMVALWNRARRAHGHPLLPVGYGYDDYLARNAEAGDIPDRLDDQLGWLADAGFDPVECYWRYANRAVFGGVRAA